MLHCNLPEMVIGQVNDTYAMHNMHEQWINVFHNINMQVRWGQWLCPVKDYSPTHIGVFRQLSLFRGQNLFHRWEAAQLTWLPFASVASSHQGDHLSIRLSRSWCLHQGDHPSQSWCFGSSGSCAFLILVLAGSVSQMTRCASAKQAKSEETN